jgi:hypothetical protein
MLHRFLEETNKEGHFTDLWANISAGNKSGARALMETGGDLGP